MAAAARSSDRETATGGVLDTGTPSVSKLPEQSNGIPASRILPLRLLAEHLLTAGGNGSGAGAPRSPASGVLAPLARDALALAGGTESVSSKVESPGRPTMAWRALPEAPSSGAARSDLPVPQLSQATGSVPSCWSQPLLCVTTAPLRDLLVAAPAPASAPAATQGGL